MNFLGAILLQLSCDKLYCNSVALLQQFTEFQHAMTHPYRQHAHAHSIPPQGKITMRLSVLAWPAWRRILVVLPLVIALWLAVWWANMGVSPW
jgi:hypothetical protein